MASGESSLVKHLWLAWGLETPHTWGLTSSEKGRESSFPLSDCKCSDTRQRKLSVSSFPHLTLVWRQESKSLPSRGAGQPGLYKKGWVPCRSPTLQWRGLVKFRLWDFLSTLVTILVRESKHRNWKGRTEKAAPPPSERSSQGSRGVIWISPFWWRGGELFSSRWASSVPVS